MIKIFKTAAVFFCMILLGAGALVLRYTAVSAALVFIKNKDKKMKTCSQILSSSWMFYLKILKFFRIADVKFKDLEKISAVKNSIIVSAHPSLLDIVILIAHIPYTTCFAAEKIGRNPFFRPMAELLFVIKNRNIDDWLYKSLKFLEKGYNIVIFPMGSRHAKNEHLKIRKGAALLAQKSGKNITVLNIENDFDFLAKNKPVYRISDKITNYTVSYLGIINTKEMMKEFPDEAACRKKITAKIEQLLYYQQ